MGWGSIRNLLQSVLIEDPQVAFSSAFIYEDGTLGTSWWTVWSDCSGKSLFKIKADNSAA
jgi:hypothetical protein